MTEPTHDHAWVEAYHRMMERVKHRLEALEQAEQEALPQLQASIEHAHGQVQAVFNGVQVNLVAQDVAVYGLQE